MTTIARIVERFTMKLEADPGRGEWFLDYVLRAPKSAGKHLTAGWMALQAVREVYDPKEIRTVTEYFGGMGAQALMVRETFSPTIHGIMDYSAEAVAHINREVIESKKLLAVQADAYDPRFTVDADLVMLDYGDLTAWKTREGEKHRQLLDRVFLLEPKAVVFTDIACRYLHLHRERYETLLGEGTCASYQTYLEALLVRLRELYSYTLVAGYWDRWSSVMALVPKGAAPIGQLFPTPESPVGLELF